MKRTSIIFNIDNVSTFKESLLIWSQQYSIISWLDSNNYHSNYHSFDAALAVEEKTSIILNDTSNAFQLLSNYRNSLDDYIFGFLSYDLKNETEHLSSNNLDELCFPSLYFFQPKKLIYIKGKEVTFSYLEEVKNQIDNDYKNILLIDRSTIHINQFLTIKLKQRIPKDSYIKKCNTLLNHIQRGDIYEVNFCMEFFVEHHEFNPLKAYYQLNKISEPPFATFLKVNHLYLCSASPERYLKKIGTTVISQPIKGTAKRGATSALDEKIKNELKNNQKERSENIMIVDLVRNDLSKNAIKGSVKVAELCEVYTFKQVHQLISTIVAKVKEETDPINLIIDTFPMGSMTGAPKISAMKIIEEIEETKRGLYSGAVGYFTPNGDFDFNVVIRTILHNTSKKYTSFSVGSAITALSNPEQEYEECLLKGKALVQALSSS